MPTYSQQQAYYRVTIDGTPFAANNDGFIDNTQPEQYSPLPSSEDTSTKKEAANFRWQEIQQQISMHASPILVGNFTKIGGNADSAPTSFAFTVGYDRIDCVYAHNLENSPSGVDILQGETAVKRLVARAMMSDIFPSNTYYYNPTIVDGNPQGSVIRSVGASPLTTDLTVAEGAITVTKIDI